MTHFHIVHLVPTERHHGLYGYNEVIQTISWGLSSLGHTTTYGKNQFVFDCKNIVFGHQIAEENILSLVPKGSIVYNLEQYHRLTTTDVHNDPRFSFPYTVKNFEIWDYSEDNIELWRSLGNAYPISKVPIGYAPILSRIPKAEVQDIDVLIYGSPSENRLEIFKRLCHQGLKVMFLYGFYGEARDAMISRAKIVLNIGQYDRTFEIVRVSYLMANRKAVVADLYENITVESDIANGVLFANFDQVVPNCLRLLENEEARIQLENRGFEAISNRNITTILSMALNGDLVVAPAS